MRRLDAIRLVAIVVLGVAAGVLAVRIARSYQSGQTGGALRAEVGRVRISTVEPATRARLAALPARVSATYYVSGAEHMPSHMRRVEAQVTSLLQALHAVAPDRFDFQIVDPETDPDLAGFASRRRIAPYRERSVSGDAYSERTIWSSLALSYGTHPEAVIDGIGPDVLPRLQATIVAHLDQMERPRRPVYAVSAPPGFDELADTLAETGEVRRVRLDGDDPFPFDADLLFWMAPRRVTPERLDQLDRFLADGRSAVVAGSLYAASAAGLVEVDGGPAIGLEPSGFPADVLYGHLGLRAVPGLVCDGRADVLTFGEQTYDAPFLVRCIAPNQNFRLWSRQPNGSLLFAAPTPIALDGPALEQRGWNATVLATSSDTTWLMDAPVAPRPPLAVAAMTPENGTPVAKEPLLVELRPDDPWQGRLVVAAATTPFEDGLLSREHLAHRPLLRTLTGELTSNERLVMADAALVRPQPLPATGATTRLLWRGAVVFLLPLVLAGVALARGTFRGSAPTPPRHAGRRVGIAVLALAAVVLVPRVADALGWRLDATADGLNGLAPESRAIARKSAAEGAIDVELVLSERDRLPPAWRPLVDRLARTLDELERAGAPLERRRVRPDELDDAARAALEGEGIVPTRVVTSDEEVTTVRTVYAAVRFTRAGRTELVTFPGASAFEDLELRLTFALWRLATGRAPHVAFASDVPRLSAAEAHEQYQQQGLFAPKGVDVYSQARASLERAGYRVTHVNPREPQVPADADVLVWMQPRRSVSAMLEAMVRHLVGGGRVLLAAQHFNIQSRQYRGADFELVYWPQPQSPDVDFLYFPEVGIELVREVLFDRLNTAITTDTQITGRTTGRDFQRQTSALPFLIRAVAANFAEDPVTAHLGDQAFVWGDWLRWDDERLAELGLEAEALISTSPETWSYAWRGGWIPPELLDGPPSADDALDDEVRAATTTPGRVPLAVRFRGTFPVPEAPLDLGPRGEDGEEPARFDATGWPTPVPGELVFVGCSELFKDHRLSDPDFRGDHLLRNVVASLALPPELAPVATRRRVPRGFDFVETETRLFWRAFVVAAGPLALVLCALPVTLLRRRRPPSPHARTTDGSTGGRP